MPWLSAAFDYKKDEFKTFGLFASGNEEKNRESKISGTCSVELELSISASKIEKIEKYFE